MLTIRAMSDGKGIPMRRGTWNIGTTTRRGSGSWVIGKAAAQNC